MRTKIAVAIDEDGAVAAELAPGRANDCPLLMAALVEARELSKGIDAVVAK